MNGTWDQVTKGAHPGGQLDRINELCVSGSMMSCGAGEEMVSLGEGSPSQGCPHQTVRGALWCEGLRMSPTSVVVAAWL